MPTTPAYALRTPLAPRINIAAHQHPLRGPASRFVGGYAVMTLSVLLIGLTLVHVLDGTVGHWDRHLDEWMSDRRTDSLNSVTGMFTHAVNTMPAVAIATVSAIVLSVRRLFREAWFLVVALTLEVLVFLSTTFVVHRDRPSVPRLDSAPSTSSFPSGHTAAATVLAVGLALVLTWHLRRVIPVVLGWILGVGFVACVGLGRVYRGMHHLTDVLFGALLGLACLYVAMLVVRAYCARRRTADTAEEPESVHLAAAHPEARPIARTA